jgi:hypothetical protein
MPPSSSTYLAEAVVVTRRDFLKLSGVIAALPFLPRLTSPATFEQELAAATRGDTLLLDDGIYPITVPVLDVRCNLIAQPGARPILVRANGFTPSVLCHDDTIVSGIWFGGARDTVERGWLHFLKRVIFQGNVLFNFHGGIGEGAGNGNIYRRNVFVNCGTGTNYHSVYINNSNSLHTAHVLENILIGGQGYHIHLWHGPTNTIINGNLSADADYCFVLQGKDNTATNNIFWKPTSPGFPINMTGGTGNIYKRNFHGPITQGSTLGAYKDWFGNNSFDGRGVILSENHYYPNMQRADKAPVIMALGSEATYLGKTAAEIDAAVSGLKVAFAGTPQQIHDDATIGGHVAALQSVINKWAGQ